MPNHITTLISFEGTRSSEVLEFIKGEKTAFDFNKVIPMPESLTIESSSLGDDAHRLLFGGNKKDIFAALYRSVESLQESMCKMPKDRREDAIRLALIYQSNIEQYGHSTWYGWAQENWGTKWNAYDVEEIEGGIRIDTAWCFPYPVIEKLSSLFLDVTIKCTYADEDSGSNTGKLIFENGELKSYVQPESQSISGYEIYFEVNPSEYENYELTDGKYEYKEESE